jgi:hypothetical protein
MEFGLHKCAKIVRKREKLVHPKNLILYINRELQQLEQWKTSKCTGTVKSHGKHQEMKEDSKKK